MVELADAKLSTFDSKRKYDVELPYRTRAIAEGLIDKSSSTDDKFVFKIPEDPIFYSVRVHTQNQHTHNGNSDVQYNGIYILLYRGNEVVSSLKLLGVRDRYHYSEDLEFDKKLVERIYKSVALQTPDEVKHPLGLVNKNPPTKMEGCTSIPSSIDPDIKDAHKYATDLATRIHPDVVKAILELQTAVKENGGGSTVVNEAVESALKEAGKKAEAAKESQSK